MEKTIIINGIPTQVIIPKDKKPSDYPEIIDSKEYKKSKEFKPNVKEKWRKDATIKIKTLLEVTQYPKGCYTNKPKLINVGIDKSTVICSTSFKATKKGRRELLKYIKENLYL
jgi:hypothetical protein